jgi:hypothetical protein
VPPLEEARPVLKLPGAVHLDALGRPVMPREPELLPNVGLSPEESDAARRARLAELTKVFGSPAPAPRRDDEETPGMAPTVSPQGTTGAAAVIPRERPPGIDALERLFGFGAR